jgi:hypothetical protein
MRRFKRNEGSVRLFPESLYFRAEPFLKSLPDHFWDTAEAVKLGHYRTFILHYTRALAPVDADNTSGNRPRHPVIIYCHSAT